MTTADHPPQLTPDAAASPSPPLDAEREAAVKELLETYKCNDAQRDAVLHEGGPLAVLAGPGTGKTRVIIGRVLRLLGAGVRPESICGITFTVKAAEEMRSRLAQHTSPDTAARVKLGTFHALGSTILSKHGSAVGLPPTPRLADSAEVLRALRETIADLDPFPDRAAEGIASLALECRAFIDKCREAARSPADALAYADQWHADIESRAAATDADACDIAAERTRQRFFAGAARVYEHHEAECRSSGRLSYDHFITLPAELLRDHQPAAARVRGEIRHVVVDEFQDVNPAQIEFLRQLAPPSEASPPDLVVVGDDDQAIYAFRGSDTAAFERFERIWQGSRRVALTINYRSEAPIIDAARRVIERSNSRFDDEKQLEPDPGRPAPDPGAGTSALLVSSDHDHGRAIAAHIIEERDASGDPEAFDYAARAVICRTNNEADRVADELRFRGIPVDRRRTMKPLDDPAVQDVLSWVRALLDPDAAADIQRLLVRPPFACNMADIAPWFREERNRRRVAAGSTASGSNREGAPAADMIEAVRQRATDDQPGAQQFISIYDELRPLAATRPADEVIEAIIRRSGVLYAEPLPPTLDGARLRHLVQVLRFARRRLHVIEQPRTLAAFWSHYEQLDDTEQQFVSPDAGKLDTEDEHAEAETASDSSGGDAVDPRATGGAVTVITAHASKGLEFDTVYIARVSPPHGFPKTAGGEEEPVLPEAFSGIPTLPLIEDERRLFYVACTRAERRLFLLAKSAKKRSASIHFLDELRHDEPDLAIDTGDAEALIERTAGAMADELSAGLGEDDAAITDEGERAIRHEIALERQRLLSILHSAEQGSHSADRVAALAAEAAQHVGLIAALGHLRRTGALPTDYPPLPITVHGAEGAPASITPASLDAIAGAIASGAPADPRRAGIGFEALRPPLKLSFSFVDDYLRCPRCFFIKRVLMLPERTTRALQLGNVVHDALERFFGLVRDAESGEPGVDTPSADQLMRLVEERFASALRTDRDVEPEADALDRAKAMAANALAVHAAQPGAHIAELENIVRFPYAVDGTEHIFTAKLDRLDRMPTGGYRLIDYKTGNASKEKLEPRKTDLQLGVYAMALGHFVGADDQGNNDALAGGEAQYWMLKTGEHGSIPFDDLDITKIRSKIDKAVRGILAGDYPRHEPTCRGDCGLLDGPPID
jgi:DNA helicase-2/ATP-dependent DNA helicase PcrA